MNHKKKCILVALDRNPMTVDEFLRAGWGVYVNAWAPTFTNLKQDGLIQMTDEKRLTRWGKPAHVHKITRAGRRALKLEAA